MAKIINNSISVITVGTGATVTVADSVQTITGSVDAQADYVELQVTGGDIRVTFDGTDPVAGVTGYIYYAGSDPVQIKREDADSMKAIREDSTSGVIYMESKTRSY